MSDEIFTEDVLSRPWARCPKPALWHTRDNQSTELEVIELAAGLVRALQPELVLETGTAFGHWAFAVGTALKKNGHGRLVSLEIDPTRVNVARKRCEGLPVEIRLQSSFTWKPPGLVDLAWFDSAFELRSVEFQRFRPFFHSRTVCCFHDTAPHWGITERVETVLEGLRRITLPTPRGLTLAEIP